MQCNFEIPIVGRHFNLGFQSLFFILKTKNAVGILTLMSRINVMLRSVEHESFIKRNVCLLECFILLQLNPLLDFSAWICAFLV